MEAWQVVANSKLSNVSPMMLLQYWLDGDFKWVAYQTKAPLGTCRIYIRTILKSLGFNTDWSGPNGARKKERVKEAVRLRFFTTKVDPKRAAFRRSIEGTNEIQ